MAATTKPGPSRPKKTKPRTAPAVTVRMYRQGLGDCFLLTFPRTGAGGGKPFYMLIDCGVILGTSEPESVMTAVAKDIRQTTGGRVDVLVATHEHWDHLSGFLQAKSEFEQITVGDLWLAWTEQPGHPLGDKLRNGRRAALTTLRKTAMTLAGMSRPGAEQAATTASLVELLGFFGDNAAAGALGLAGGTAGTRGGGTTEDALRFLNARVERPRYCHPGEPPIALPGVDGVRVYVLGPPEDEQLIKMSDPTKRGREVYELASGSEFETAFLAAADQADLTDDQLDPDQKRQRELSLPFDDCHAVDPKAASAHSFFKAHYGFDPADDAPAWRRIEDDWLGGAGSLALKLDSDTNNTSLALAIELVGAGADGQGLVLLFPGDAQVGNWLSWGSLRWPKDARDGDPAAVTHRRLLERTVLYKVGHHASHNATLREQGLELMTHPDLVAMVPVNAEMAKKKRWAMPFPSLFARLHEKARGRVLRADEPLAKVKGVPRPATLASSEWDLFKSRLRSDAGDELYVEYDIPLGPG